MQSIVSMNKCTWSKLVLDNTANVFRVFPNGVTTMISDDYIYGDYVGRMQSNNTLGICTYIWPKSSCLKAKIWSIECQISVVVDSKVPSLSYEFKVNLFDVKSIDSINYEILDASSRIQTLSSMPCALVAHVKAIYNTNT